MDTFYIRIFYYSISQGFNVHINIVPSALPRWDIQEWSPAPAAAQNIRNGAAEDCKSVANIILDCEDGSREWQWDKEK